MRSDRSRPWIYIVALALLAATAAVPALAVEQRTFRESFPLSSGDTLRLANLAGTLTLVPGTGSEVTVEATVYAEGRSASETQRLLQGMRWVDSRDSKGRAEKALSYPVEDYRGFHFPGAEGRNHDPNFWERLAGRLSWGETNSHYRGERVSVYGRRSSSAPTLYADLRIAVPASGKLAVRNVVGPVYGDELAGDLSVDTGSGHVEIAGFDGNLNVDTGSGRVVLGQVRGETKVDTGSGSIEIGELVGNGDLDTGSGGVEVNRVAAGKLSIDTGSGGITVRDGTAGTLIADTGSGGIRVLGVDVEVFEGDTGSGGVVLESPLTNAREVVIDTGSGSVRIYAGADASFDIAASLGSGSLHVGYDDAVLHKRGHRVVGAERGDRRTRIRVDTGSGSCTITPLGSS